MQSRCRYFTVDGTPINGGCRDPHCPFVHPDKQIRRTKVPVRCKFFNEKGEPIGNGCKHSSMECPFTHPDEPKWASLAEKSEPSMSSGSTKDLPVGSRALKRVITNFSSGQDQSEGPTAKDESSTPRSAVAPGTISTNIASDRSRRVSFPFRKVIGSPVTESPVLSTPGDYHGSDLGIGRWKKILSILAHACAVQHELWDIEVAIQRKMEIMSHLCHPTQVPTKQELEAPSQEKRKALEDKMKGFDKELLDLGFWSFEIRVPPDDATKSCLESLPHIDKSLEELQLRFDEFGNKFREQYQHAKDIKTASEPPEDLADEVQIAFPGQAMAHLSRLQEMMESLPDKAAYIDELTDLIDSVDTFIEQEGSSLKTDLEGMKERFHSIRTEKSKTSSLPELEPKFLQIQEGTSKLRENVLRIVAEQLSINKQHASVMSKSRLLAEELENLQKSLQLTPSLTPEDHEQLTKNVVGDIQTHIDRKSVHGQELIISGHTLLRKHVMEELKPTMDCIDTLRDTMRLP